MKQKKRVRFAASCIAALMLLPILLGLPINAIGSDPAAPAPSFDFFNDVRLLDDSGAELHGTYVASPDTEPVYVYAVAADTAVLLAYSYEIPEEGLLEPDSQYSVELPEELNPSSVEAVSLFGGDKTLPLQKTASLSTNAISFSFSQEAIKSGLLNPGSRGEIRILASWSSDRLTGEPQELRFALGSAGDRSLWITAMGKRGLNRAGEMDFSTYLTDVGFYKSNPTVGGDPIALGENELISRTDDIILKYSYGFAAGTILPWEQIYTIQVPEAFTLTDSTLNFQIKATDADLVIGNCIAYANNKIEIRFTKEAFDEGYLGENYDRVVGDLWINANCNSEKIPNEGIVPIPFSIGGAFISKEIHFQLDPVVAEVKLDKPTPSTPDLVNKTITWSVKVTAKLKNGQAGDKIENVSITDTLPSTNHSYQLGSFTLDGTPTSDPSGLTVASSSFTYSFGDMADGETKTLSYQTDFTLSAFASADRVTFKNKAEGDFQYQEYVQDPDTGVVTKKSAADGTPVLTGKVTDPKEKEASISVSGGFLDKQSTESSLSGRTIDWKITVNANAFGLGALTVTDTIPKGLTLDETSVKDNGVPLAKGSDFTYTSVSGGTSTLTLTIADADADIKHVITYQTKVTEADVEDNENGILKFANQAVLTGSGLNLTKTATVNFTQAGGLAAKSGRYDPSSHKITWTIAVNANGVDMTNTTVTDRIPEDQKFIEMKGAVPVGITPTYTEADRTLTITYPDGTGTHTVSFETELLNKEIYGNNIQRNGLLTNSATLETTLAAGTKTVSFSGTADVNSQVLAKEGKGYDVIKKRAQWKITVNRNQMPISNAVITDTIPEGQKYVAEGAVLPAGASANYDEPTRILTITLGDITAKQEISYWTELTDTSILESNAKPTIENKAKLTGDTVADNVSVTATQTIAKSIVTKEGTQAGAAIQWTVVVNENLVRVDKPTLEDVLNENLTLDPSSVHLWQLEDNTRTKIQPEISLTPDAVTYDTSTNTFRFHFPNAIEHAYQLEFKTDLSEWGTYTNSIGLLGGSVDVIGTSRSVVTSSAGAGGSSTLPKTGRVEITKNDNLSTPLEGVEFLLDGTIKGTSDVNGRVIFDRVRVGAHTLQEIKTKDGYVLDSTVKSIAASDFTEAPDPSDATKTIKLARILIVNQQIKGSLEVTKVDSGNNLPLANAEITVYRSDDTIVATQKTGVDGKAIFTGLLYGNYYYMETAAPSGYYRDTQKHPFTVASDGQVIAEVLKNTLYPSKNIDYGSGNFEDEVPPPSDDESTIVVKPGPDGNASGKLDNPNNGPAEIVTKPENGEISLGEDGSWVYVPNPGYQGSDRFTIRIQREDGSTERILVEIGEPEVPLADKLPQTGEASPIWFYMAGGVLVLAGIGLRFFNRGKGNSRKENAR